MRALAGCVALGFSIALASCNRDPKCQGKLNSNEIVRIRDLDSRGANPCPEHHDPTIRLGSKGIELGNRVLVEPDGVPRDGFPRPIGPLFLELEQNRKTWQKVHQGADFDGRASIEIPSKTAFITGASTITTAVRAGYLRVRVEAGEVSFDATCDVPGAPKRDGVEPWRVYVDQKDGAYRGTVKQGKIVVAYVEQKGPDELVSWIDTMCGAGRCDVVVPQLEGEFGVAAKLLRRILDLKSLAQHPPRLRFERDG